ALVTVAKKLLDGKVSEVRVSSRLTESPACLVLTKSAMPAHLERMLEQAGRGAGRGKRDLELNPTHPVITKLGALAQANAEDAKLGDLVTVLYEQSLLAEGAQLEDPAGFVKRLTHLMAQAVG